MNLFKNTNELFQGAAQGLFRGPAEPPQDDPLRPLVQQQKDEEKPSYVKDIALAPLRGVEGAAQGLYNLADTIAFDALPDWQEDSRLFGRSETMVGGLVEGLSQFLIPFFPLKAAMKVGKVGKAFAKLGGKKSDIARDVIAGSVVDFAAFDGQEARLSNLVNMSPALKTDVTEYLAAEKDDPELEGRLKNTLEGLIIEAGMRSTFGAVGMAFRGIKAIKLRQQKMAAGKDPEQAAQEAINESGIKEDELGQLELDFGDDLRTPADFAGVDSLGKQLELGLENVEGPRQMEMFDEAGNPINQPRLLRHGSPHAFRGFDTDNIGRGEGHQAFGYGLYFAENRGVARHYGRHQYTVEVDVKEDSLVKYDQSFKEASPEDLKKISSAFRKAMTTSDREWNAGSFEDILDDPAFDALNLSDGYYKNFAELYNETMDRVFRDYHDYDRQSDLNTLISRFLLEEGFEGIKYLDGMSRKSEAKPYHNYVIFNDKKIKVLTRDGKPLPKNVIDPRSVGGSLKNRTSQEIGPVTSGFIKTELKEFEKSTAYEVGDVPPEYGLLYHLEGDYNIPSKIKVIDIDKPEWIKELQEDFKQAELATRDPKNGIKTTFVRKDTDNHFVEYRFSDQFMEDTFNYTDQLGLYKIGTNAKGEDIHIAAHSFEYEFEGVQQTLEVIVNGKKLDGSVINLIENRAVDPTFTRYEDLTAKVNDILEKNETPIAKDPNAEQLELKLDDDVAEEVAEVRTTSPAEDNAALDASTAAARAGVNIPMPNLEDMSYKEIQAEAKRIGVGGKGARIQLVSKIEDFYNQQNTAKLPSVGEDGQLRMFEGEAEGTGPRGPREVSEETIETARELDRRIADTRQEKMDFFHDEQFLEESADARFKFTGQETFVPSKQRKLEDTVLEVAKQLEDATGERGGAAALTGTIRNVANQGGLMLVARALALNIEKGADLKKMSFEDILKDAESGADELGVKNQHDMLAKLHEANKNKTGGQAAIKKIRAEQSAIRTINRQIGMDMKAKADEIYEFQNTGKNSSGKNLDELEAELLTLLDKHRSSQQLWSIYGRELSGAFLQRKAYYQGTGGFNKRLGLSGQQVLNSADRMHYRKKQIGSMSTTELVKKIRQAGNNPDNVLRALNRTTKATEGSKLMNMTLEYWMNSLLSSPVTQMVNVLGALGVYHMKAAEGFAGAVLNGDKELATAISANIYKIESIREAWHYMKLSFKQDDAVLAPDARVYDDSAERGAAIASNSEDAFGQTINHIGKLVRFPSRTLLAGDELFKQLNYRYFVRTEKMASELRKGSTLKRATEVAEEALEAATTKKGAALNERSLGKEVYDAVAAQDAIRIEKGQGQMTPEEFDNAFREMFASRSGALRRSDQDLDLQNPNLEFDPNDPRYRTADAALDYAKVATATKDIPQIQDPLGKLAQMVPVAKMVFPFVRTPTNLLKMGFERTPLGIAGSLLRDGMHGKFMSRLREIQANGTKREVAQMKGQMATATASTVALITYISSNGDFVSGAGPRNRDEREALRMTGWQPYSIKVGNKWMSYRRQDPMSTQLGILADLAEIPKYYDLSDSAAESLFTMSTVAFMNNITSQSFVDGIDNLFKVVRDPITYGPRFVGSIAGGFVPNAVNFTQNLGEDKMLRETRTIFDHVLTRVPSGSSSLPPRRNFLGEAQIIDMGLPILGAFNPFYTSPVKSTPVDNELGRLLHGFSMPESKIGGADNLDLKKMRTSTGQDAYDRYLELSGTMEIGGKTLRENLNELVQTSAYRNMPENDIADDTGLTNPRVRALSKLIRFYRMSARNKLMNEVPQLQTAIYNNQRQKQQYLAQR